MTLFALVPGPVCAIAAGAELTRANGLLPASLPVGKARIESESDSVGKRGASDTTRVEEAIGALGEKVFWNVTRSPRSAILVESLVSPKLLSVREDRGAQISSLEVQDTFGRVYT